MEKKLVGGGEKIVRLDGKKIERMDGLMIGRYSTMGAKTT